MEPDDAVLAPQCITKISSLSRYDFGSSSTGPLAKDTTGGTTWLRRQLSGTPSLWNSLDVHISEHIRASISAVAKADHSPVRPNRGGIMRRQGTRKMICLAAPSMREGIPLPIPWKK